MKLIMESWRSYVNEIKCWPGHRRVPGTTAGAKGSCEKITEAEASYFGAAFDKYVQLVEGGRDPLKTARQMFKQIGEGSTRAVFVMPDNNDFVLKVINTDVPSRDPKKNPDPNAPGVADLHGFTIDHKRKANQWEANLPVQLGNSDLFPRSTERAKDFSWILVEKVEPLTPQRFFNLLKLPHPPFTHKGLTQVVAAAIGQLPALKESFADEETVVNDPAGAKTKINPPRVPKPVAAPKLDWAAKKRKELQANATQLARNAQVVRILQLMKKHNIKLTEFKPSNMGISPISNKLVFLDVSMWE